jgi:hypothetical protein
MPNQNNENLIQHLKAVYEEPFVNKEAQINESLMEAFVSMKPEKPKAVTPEPKNTKLIQNAYRIPLNDDYYYLNSRYTWDYQSIELNGETYMIDGGLDYIRKTVNPEQEDWCLYSDSSSEEINNKLLWGNSINADGSPRKSTLWYPIAQLELDHLRAIIRFFEGSESKISELHNQVINYWIKQKSK